MLSLVITLALIPMPHEKFIKLSFTLAFAVFIYTVLTTSFIDKTNIFSRMLVLIEEKSYFMYLNEALVIGLMKIGGDWCVYRSYLQPCMRMCDGTNICTD